MIILCEYFNLVLVYYLKKFNLILVYKIDSKTNHNLINFPKYPNGWFIWQPH
jgi:hypothetical protein